MARMSDMETERRIIASFRKRCPDVEVDSFGKIVHETPSEGAPVDTNFANDIPYQIAAAAHAGTSHVPERRAEQEREGYAATLRADYTTLLRYADTDEKKVQLEVEFSRYRAGYRAKMLAYLGARSRCMSSMITGPANFPTRRNQKRNTVADKRSEDLTGFRERALAAIRKVLTPELAPIMAGDADAPERLGAKIAAAEASQAAMKAANVAIRKHKKAGPAAQLEALKALCFSEAQALEALKPDFVGRVGFATYQLSNNNANIARMKARLASINEKKAEPVVETTTADGIRVEDCPADNRIRVFFPGKPDAEVRAGLKANGFRWTPSIGCWGAYRNNRAFAHAKTFLPALATPALEPPAPVDGAGIRVVRKEFDHGPGLVRGFHVAGINCGTCTGERAHAMVEWSDTPGKLFDEDPADLERVEP